MSKIGWIHGSTVDPKTRRVRYLSSSSLKLADMSTEKGCLRKWWYSYVKGVKEEQTWQQAAGERDHATVERYLETGERVFTPRVAKGIHMLPPPGPRLTVEHDMVPVLYPDCKPDHEHTKECKKKSGLEIAPLTAAGIPMVGRIDLMHDLCMNYGAENPEAIQDPDGTVEVFDHKFTKDLRYALKGIDMVKDIQMVSYGMYVFLTVPGVRQVRLSHGYYPTNGNAAKRTILVGKETLEAYWSEHVEPLARSIADAAKEENPDKVRPNLKACKAYGRLCVNAETCSAAMDAGLSQSLSSQVGGAAAQSLLQIIKKPKDPTMALTPGKGLLAHIKQPAADTAAREAELAKLKAEEAAAKKIALPEGLLQTVQQIEAISQKNNLGWPKLTGKAAEAYVALTGQGRAANGALEGVEVVGIEQFDTLLKELLESFPAPQAAVPAAGLLPSDAPEIDTGTVYNTPSETQAEVVTHAQAMADIAADADKPKATRKPRTIKAKDTPTPPVTETTAKVEEAKVALQDAREAVQAQADARVNLFVDVTVEGTQFIDLAIQIDTLTEAMSQKFDLEDIRTGSEKSPLGYGKWKGVLNAAIRESDILGPGTYHIDARGNEIYEEAVQAMRQLVKRTGGVYVRGTK